MEVEAEVTAMPVDARNAILWQLILAKPRSPALTRFHSLASYVLASVEAMDSLCFAGRFA